MGSKKSPAPAPAQPAPTVTYNTTPINRESQARMAAAQDANKDTPTGLIPGTSEEEEKRRQAGLLTGMSTA